MDRQTSCALPTEPPLQTCQVESCAPPFPCRLKMLESGQFHKLAGRGKQKADMDKYTSKADIKVYNSAADSTLPKKRKAEEEGNEEPKTKKKKVS